jgi:uncharacterized protein
MQKLTHILALLFLTNQLLAQDSIKIAVRGQYIKDQDAILLRWVPSNQYTWHYGMIHPGYIVKRFTKARNGVELPYSEMYASETVIEKTILIRPESEWDALADQYPMAGVAAGMIFNGSFEVDPNHINLNTVMQKKKEAQDRYGFALFAADQEYEVAKAMGLGIVDNHKIEQDAEYLYVVEPMQQPNPDDKGAFGVTSVLATNQDMPMPQFLDPNIGDRVVMLEWEAMANTYTSYTVERSFNPDPNSNEWQPRNVQPIILLAQNLQNANSISWSDSLDSNGEKYYYRLVGKTPFGIKVTNPDAIEVIGVPGPKDLQMRIDSTFEASSGQITISFSLLSGLLADVAHYNVYRSPDIDGQYELLAGNIPNLRPGMTTNDQNPGSAMYYYVEAIDVNGHPHASFPMLGQVTDNSAPATPTFKSGKVEPNGRTTLIWSENTEPDFSGVQVFMAHGNNSDFVQVTTAPIADTIYRTQVPMQILNEEVWFKIRALDVRGNRSPMSAAYMVTKPDVHGPVPPIITTFTPSSIGVQFFWELSSSPDVRLHVFERKQKNTNTWEELLRFKMVKPAYTFTDTTASKRKSYTYRLIAIDDALLTGISKTVDVKPYDDGLRDPITNVQYQLDPSTKAVYMTWSYPIDPDLKGFQVYRAIQDTTQIRSYAYCSIPVPVNNQPGYFFDAAIDGRNWNVAFADIDTRFKHSQIVQYVKGPNVTAQNNQSLLAGGQVNQSPTYVVQNANNMTVKGNGPVTVVYYYIMAEYHDGGFSPRYGPIVINL